MNKSVRVLGAVKFVGASSVAMIGWYLVYLVSLHWHRIPIGGSIPIVGLPAAYALVGLAELMTGLPAKAIGSKLNQHQLAPWQENIIWLLVFLLGIAAMMAAMIFFA